MLFTYLIFLSTGVFITCRPTTARPAPTNRTLLNKEIQKHLNKLIEKSPVAQNLNTTTFRTPRLTHKVQEQCAVSRLRALIKLLEPVKIESNEDLDRLYTSLQSFQGFYPPQEKSDRECETEEYTPKTFRDVLIDIKRIMKELF